MLKNKNLGIYLSLISVAFLWGTSFAISKIGLYELTPLNLAGLRFFVAAILFGLILLIKKAKIHKKDIPQLIVMGFMAITSYFYIQYTGLLYTTSINASLLLATSPVWTTIASGILQQEQINRNTVGGILVAFFGVSLVISKGNFLTLFASETILGDVLMLLNATVWAIFTLYGKRIMTKYSPFTAVAYITIFGAIMLLPVVCIPNPLNPISLFDQVANISMQTVGALLYLAVFCSVYAYYSWYHGIEIIGAVRTASFYYTSPLFALAAGVWLLKETISPLVVFGGIAVIAGVYITNKNRTN
ncbi:MAG: DMT family transporter [Sporomusaceae bacterium]|nr:DMT family transporter [Sporomusaceae bacterium]